MADITGTRIREARLAQGMSQVDLALKSGYKSRSSINKIEHDSRRTTLDKIKEIAAALNVTPDYLLGWEDDPHGEIPRETKISEIEKLFQMLDPEQQRAVFTMISAIVSAKPTEQH